jgi:DNA polymerase III epsilon subunit-like protein
MKSIRSYLVFDFETSGLEPASHRILQVGLCRVTDDAVTDRQCWLVRQEVPIDPEAARLHRITLEDLRARGIPPQESLTRLLAAMQNAPVCMGHNIHRFDVAFLQAESRRLGVPAPDAREFIDTAALFKGWKLGMTQAPGESHQEYAQRVLAVRTPGLRFSVEACLRELRIQAETGGLHAADEDAYLTHRIFEALREKL